MSSSVNVFVPRWQAVTLDQSPIVPAEEKRILASGGEVRSNHPLQAFDFVLALAAIRRSVVPIKAIDEGDLVPL